MEWYKKSMIGEKLKAIFILLLIVIFSECQQVHESIVQNVTDHEWILSELLNSKDSIISLKGNPQPINCKYGEALLFDGKNDGAILDIIPLYGLGNFTIEALLRPDSSGIPEQIFFQCNMLSGDYVILKIITVDNFWYFNSSQKAGEHKDSMNNQNRLNPLDQWYHIAFVFDKGIQSLYINGKEELRSYLNYPVVNEGKSEIGINHCIVAGFKGAVFKIKCSSDVVKPSDFINY